MARRIETAVELPNGERTTERNDPERALRIELLGGFRVATGTRLVEAPAWRLQKASSLVKLLALAPGYRLHREQVMELLWPDLEIEAAANNLYYALHIARKALAGGEPGRPHPAASALRLQRQMLFLQPDGPLHVDVTAFESAAAAARMARGVAAYRAAIQLYTGDLLPEDCYEDWAAGRREALRETYLTLLLALARLHEAQGALDAAIDTLERVIATEPAHEEAYTSLMRLHAYAGRGRQAQRQYERLRETLQRELGAEPERETRRIYEAIVAGTLSRPALKAPPPATPSRPHQPEPMPGFARETVSPVRGPPNPTPALPLVGRERELTALISPLREAGGAARVVVVSGEPGAGKTRLAEELLACVGRQGVVTAQAQCYAGSGPSAYAPVTAWLRTEPLWRALLLMDDLWLTELVRVVPEVLVERPRLAPPGPLSEPWQRGRFFEALARVFDPFPAALLLLDDLQWCDTETLEWLRYVTLERSHGRFALLLTLRTEELGTGHPATAWLTALRREARLTETVLPPLDQAGTAELAAHVTGGRLDDDTAARLYAETEGNPLFIVEMARAGAPFAANALPERGVAANPRLPPTVRAVIAARLAALSPLAREVAGIAATIGREFTLELVAAAAGKDEDGLIAGLDELWQRRVVRERDGDVYDFAHDKLREVAYAGLSAARRKLLHRRIAQALVEDHAGALQAVAAQVAPHYERAGMPAEAALYYERAAEHARALYANSEARRYYRQALALLDRLGKADAAARAREQFAYVLTIESRFDEALEELERAIAVYRAAGDGEREGHATAHLGLVHSVRGTPLEGIARLRPYVEPAATAAYSVGCCAALNAALAQLSNLCGRITDQFDYARQASACAREAGDVRLVIQADRLYGLALLMLDRPREALAVLAGVIPLAEAEDDLSNLCFALNNAGLAYMSLGKLERSHEHAVRAVQCAERLGSPTTLAFMLCNRGELASLLGDWERARRDYERAAELLRPVGLTWVSAHPLLGLGSLALARGEWEPAERYLGECLDVARRVGSTYALHMAVEALAERDLVQGRPEAARLRLAPDTSSAGDAESDSGSHTVSLAWAELDLGHAETAAALLERAVASVAKTENAHTQLLALRVRARLDGWQGRYDEGLAGLEQALALARAMPAPCAEAIVLYERGLLYLHCGDAERSHGSLEAALAIFRRLDERLYAEQAERALAEC